MAKPITLTPISKDDNEPSQVVRSAGEYLLQQAEAQGCQLFGIVDSARNEEVFRYLVTGDVQYKSLFEGTMDVQSYGVSGFLVECKKESALYQWMVGEAWGDSCSIFFTSKASFDELFKHFQQFNRVYLEDDEVVLFRYYDPRVLRVYLPTCNPDEVEVFFGEVESFFTEGEEASEIWEFRKAEQNREDPINIAITISNIKKTIGS